MAETRAKAILKETVMKETEEAFMSRLAVFEDLVADQNKKMEKNRAEMLEAIRLLAAPNASSSGAKKIDRSSPMFVSTPEKAYPSPDRENLLKSESSNAYAGLIRLGKVDFPRFDGDKIKEWLFKVEEFFEIARTPDRLKIGLASAHFDGLAATWHQSFVQSKLGRNDIHDWNTYKMLLEGRFEEVLGDPIAELKQLRETNGIAEYHMKFELLRTRVNLTEDEMVRLFVDGLQPETQVNVKMFQPQTVSQCLLIGRLYEQAHPKMVSNQSSSGSKWNGNGNQLKGILDCEEDQLSQDDNELVNIEVTVSTDLLLAEERDSSPQIEIGCELEAGETDTSIDQNQLIQEEARNHSIDSFHETSLLHHKNSLLKHQVSSSHLAFNHRSSIGSLDVYDDWPSAIVRTHQLQSNFDLEYAAINAYQVCDSMSLGAKLLTNGRRKTFLKAWRFKFKDTSQPREVIQEKLCVHETNGTMNQLMLPMHLGSHILHQQKKPSKSPKSWKFKFKSENLRKMEVNSVLEIREVVVNVVERIRQVTSVTKHFSTRQLFGKKFKDKGRWKWKKRRKALKSWRFKFKNRDLMGYNLSGVKLLFCFGIHNRSLKTALIEVRPPELFVAERMITTKVETEEDMKENDQKQQGDWGHYCLLVAAANWSPRMNLWSTSDHVWHRWKARYCFVGIISTMWAWLFGEEGFDIVKRSDELIDTWTAQIKRKSTAGISWLKTVVNKR